MMRFLYCLSILILLAACGNKENKPEIQLPDTIKTDFDSICLQPNGQKQLYCNKIDVDQL